MLMPQPALATNTADETQKDFAIEYGPARPPIGFVRFCADNPGDCKDRTSRARRITLDQERWALIEQVNSYVNGKIKPVSDMELYGEAEHWAYPVDAGDCEDYALLKQRYLLGLGFPREALLNTVVLDEAGEGHDVLTVVTDKGEFVLDNRRNDILRSRDTKYTFLKRQSQVNPRQWVALVKEKTITSGTVTSTPAQ